VCVVVAHGTPCLGPVTHAGCGALCPAHHRGCYGCFGPMETPNAGAQVGLLRATGMAEADVLRAFRTFNSGAPAFIELSQVHRRATSGARGRATPRKREGERLSHRNDRTLAVSALARVEGEGAMHVRVRGGAVEDVRLEIYEPPRFFEAFPARAAAHRTARHHRAHLRGSARSPTR